MADGNIDAGTVQQVDEKAGGTANSDAVLDAPDSWMKSIPDDVKADKYFENFKGKPIGDVLKSAAHAQRMIGKSIQVPDEKSTPEQVAAYREKLGVPKTSKDYGIQIDSTMSKEGTEKFLEHAHKLGLSTAQVKGLYDYTKSVQASAPASDAARNEAIQTLKADPDFGGANYEKNFKSIEQLLTSQGGKEVFDKWAKSDMGNDVGTIKMFAKIAQMFKQDGFLPQDVAGVQGSADAISAINAIMSLRGAEHDKHPYFNVSHPGHEQAIKDMYNLNQLAYPEVHIQF